MVQVRPKSNITLALAAVVAILMVSVIAVISLHSVSATKRCVGCSSGWHLSSSILPQVSTKAWIDQCINIKLARGNNNSYNNNNNNSSLPTLAFSPSFTIVNARAYCTHLLEASIINNHQITQNQPSFSLTNVPPGTPYQQQFQATNTPTPQYPYQSPYQQPFLNSNQGQEQPSTNANAAPPLALPQGPYQNSYPYQLHEQQQNQTLSFPQVTDPNQDQYQLQSQSQNGSSAFSTDTYSQLSSQSITTAVQPSQSNLIIVTHVNNTARNYNITKAATNANNFTQVVENAYPIHDGYTFVYHFMRGSQAGITLNLQPGNFGVFELSKPRTADNSIPGRSQSPTTSYSGDCITVKSNAFAGVYGYGIINPGETKTCTVIVQSHK
jgi:hypothetical protein